MADAKEALMKHILRITIVGIYLSGCATATRGSHEVIKIGSEPIDATAMTDLPSRGKKALNGFYGCAPTPCTIDLPRKSSPVVTISKPGYQPIKFVITSSVATSATSLPQGTIVSGLPPGSYVRVGDSDFLKTIPIGGAIIAGGVMSFGAGAVLDLAVGANKNLVPNPVTVFLAPDKADLKEP